MGRATCCAFTAAPLRRGSAVGACCLLRNTWHFCLPAPGRQAMSPADCSTRAGSAALTSTGAAHALRKTVLGHPTHRVMPSAELQGKTATVLSLCLIGALAHHGCAGVGVQAGCVCDQRSRRNFFLYVLALGFLCLASSSSLQRVLGLALAVHVWLLFFRGLREGLKTLNVCFPKRQTMNWRIQKQAHT